MQEQNVSRMPKWGASRFPGRFRMRPQKQWNAVLGFFHVKHSQRLLLFYTAGPSHSCKMGNSMGSQPFYVKDQHCPVCLPRNRTSFQISKHSGGEEEEVHAQSREALEMQDCHLSLQRGFHLGSVVGERVCVYLYVCVGGGGCIAPEFSQEEFKKQIC